MGAVDAIRWIASLRLLHGASALVLGSGKLMMGGERSSRNECDFRTSGIETGF